MRLPPFFKDLPNDAVKRVVELLNQPQLVQTIKDTAHQIGAKTEWGASQVQDSMRQAKHWLDSMASRWRSVAPPSAIPVINATGLLFSGDYTIPPTDSASNAAYSSVFAGPIDERSVRVELESRIKQATGAESAIVLQSVSTALMFLALHPQAGNGWVIPRACGIRLPDGGDVFSIFRRFGKLDEIGTVNSLNQSDFRNALTLDAKNKAIFQVFPRNLDAGDLDESNPSANTGANLSRELGLINAELRYDGTLCNLADIFPDTVCVRSRIENGADVVAFTGDVLLGGPRCGILVGKSSFIEPLRTLVEQLGGAANPITLTMMLGALDANKDADAWKKSTLGEMVTCTLANQTNRAKRIALQLEGSPLVAKASAMELSLPVGTMIWSKYVLPTAVIDVTPKEDVDSIKQQLNRYKRKIVCNSTRTSIQFVMRSIDPADDREIVSAFGVYDEPSDENAAATQVTTGA
jgi:L-seryl-tRNA(Ser) seleniumtransferase